MHDRMTYFVNFKRFSNFELYWLINTLLPLLVVPAVENLDTTKSVATTITGQSIKNAELFTNFIFP